MRHAAVEYIVAHGITSLIEGRRAIIGSAHFVFEDEGAQLESDIKEQIEPQMQGLLPLYLAVDGKVVGVLGIEGPLKPGVARLLPTCMRWASSMSLCSRATLSARPSALRERQGRRV